MDTDYVFMTRPYWQELSIPKSVVREKYIEYFGGEYIEISTRKEAVNYLLKVTGTFKKNWLCSSKGINHVVCLRIYTKYLIKHFIFI